MTARFDLKPEAFAVAASEILDFTNNDEILRARKKLESAQPTRVAMTFPHDGREIDLYTVINARGATCGIGLGTFRKGYELWDINLETGYCYRL